MKQGRRQPRDANLIIFIAVREGGGGTRGGSFKKDLHGGEGYVIFFFFFSFFFWVVFKACEVTNVSVPKGGRNFVKLIYEKTRGGGGGELHKQKKDRQNFQIDRQTAKKSTILIE